MLNHIDSQSVLLNSIQPAESETEVVEMRYCAGVEDGQGSTARGRVREGKGAEERQGGES
jgi:hypothetical protein